MACAYKKGRLSLDGIALFLKLIFKFIVYFIHEGSDKNSRRHEKHINQAGSRGDTEAFKRNRHKGSGDNRSYNSVKDKGIVSVK